MSIFLLYSGAGNSIASAQAWSEAIESEAKDDELVQLFDEFEVALKDLDKPRVLKLFRILRQDEDTKFQLFLNHIGLTKHIERALKVRETSDDPKIRKLAERRINLFLELLDEDTKLARKDSVEPVFASNRESGPIYRRILLNDKTGLERELKYLKRYGMKPAQNIMFLWAYQNNWDESVPIMLRYGLKPVASEIYLLAESFNLPAIKHLFGLLTQDQISELLASNPRKIHTHGVILLAIAAADYEFLTFLMEAGFDPSFSNKDLTPLILAQKRNDEKAISILRSYGAE